MQYGIATLFAVGMPKDSKIQKQLLKESRREHDLIQQNFHDSYRNLTWKVEFKHKLISTEGGEIKSRLQIIPFGTKMLN